MKRRLLGIPIPIIAIIAALVITSGAVAAAFLFQRTQPSVVSIKGGGVDIYQDIACTIPLGDTIVLDFGEVRTESPSDAVTFYMKNIGTDPLYPVATTNINSGLSLTETTYGVIAGTPVLLYTPLSYTWTPNGATHTLNAAMSDTAMSFTTTIGKGTTVIPCYAKIDNEIVHVISYSETSGYVWTLDERGAAGTTAAAHASAAVVTIGSVSETPADPLDPGEVQEVELQVAVTGDITPYLGTAESFNVDIEVTSDY